MAARSEVRGAGRMEQGRGRAGCGKEKSRQSYSWIELYGLGEIRHSQTALRARSSCMASGIGASSIAQNESKASGERKVVDGSLQERK